MKLTHWAAVYLAGFFVVVGLAFLVRAQPGEPTWLALAGAALVFLAGYGRAGRRRRLQSN